MLRRALPIVTILLAACGGDTPSNAGTNPAGTPTEAPAPIAPVGQDPAGNMQIFEPGGLVKPDSPAGLKVELGKLLFFDPRLSRSGKMSCSTCHLPELGWTDGRKVAPKDDGTVNTRNAPTMVNVGHLQRLYWDGRAPSLEKNILAAWKGQMSGDGEAVAQKLVSVPDYLSRFHAIYQVTPNEDNIVKSLAMFVRMLRGADAPFDRWRAGEENAVSADAKAGFALFVGKGGCVVCHQEPIFTDTKFHNTGVGMDAANPDPGAGSEKAQNDPKLLGAFKTPTLREVGRSAPYFHDGSVATLPEAVKFMAGGGRANSNLSPLLTNRNFSDAEVAQVVAFLQTLSSDAKFTPPKLPN